MSIVSSSPESVLHFPSPSALPSLLQQTRLALGELGIRPHKQHGQHFLIDPLVIGHMIEAAGLDSTDTILEIGPGLGALSDSLAKFAARLYLVEVDEVLATRLQKRFTNNHAVEVIAADFLRLSLPETFSEPTMHIVASLPYNVAIPILFRVLEHRWQFLDATVMLQKEVANRLCAVPATKAYGAVSVLMQLYATATPVCTVGPRSFFPAPQVQSQVVKLTFHHNPRVAIPEESVFRRVVKAAFAQRRKTLRNALLAAGYRQLEAVSTQTGIDMQRRGETLSLDEFAALAHAVVKG
jgi:16S rRNA (adenine1518-N6/adenine1519-N6)-dimethyltransferase